MHQLLFHPMFAGPFILQLWLDRRWRLASVYTVAYLGIGLFWTEYFQLQMRLVGIPPQDAHSVGGAWMVDRLNEVLAKFRFENIGAMGLSLVRFVTWQNPLMAPLALAGAAAAWRTGGVLRALILGIVLTLVAMLILVPSQTHGWGYRYMHGLLGSVALLAAWTWGRLTDVLPAERRKASEAAFAVAAALSLVVLTPIRAWQAHSYIAPYARANARIHEAPAQVVIIDNVGNPGFDPGTVVRNDPWLRRWPKVMQLFYMDPDMVRAVCARYSVLIYDGRNAAADGVDTEPVVAPPGYPSLRPLLEQLRCGRQMPLGAPPKL
jgi:hypothetical protein